MSMRAISHVDRDAIIAYTLEEYLNINPIGGTDHQCRLMQSIWRDCPANTIRDRNRVALSLQQAQIQWQRMNTAANEENYEPITSSYQQRVRERDQAQNELLQAQNEITRLRNELLAAIQSKT